MPTNIPDQDLNTLKQRLLEPLLDVPDLDRIRSLQDTLQPDGTWPDVDYQNMDTTHWKPIQHLNNLLLMARAFKTPASALYQNEPLGGAVFSALDHWLERDYRRPWWYNAIGIPGVLANILLLLDGEISDTQREKGLGILSRAILGATGQNLVWQANITVKRAILERNPDLAAEAYRLIASEIRLSTGEGIQPDFSFHQHGPCLYNHGYGAGFARDCAATAALVANTRFAFPQDKIDILTGYILDGSQWLSRCSAPDLGAKGREITRPNQTVHYLIDTCHDMCKLPTGRESEFRALADHVAGKTPPPREGNRHFWRSDTMVHHRKAFYASARMHAARNVNTDGLSGCDEGQKSHHISDGCNLVMRTGQEYFNIFPVWDWQKIPGTTVEQGPDQSGDPRREGTTDFVGGVSDSTCGLAACDFERDGLTARKAWFFFDTEYVCLGAGITCPSQNPVVTTLNQCRLMGDVTASDGSHAQACERGEYTLKEIAWVHHDGIAYIFPDPADVSLGNTTQTGSWQRISLQSSDAPVSDDVFKLWIDHGPAPQNAAYAYLVVPDVSVSDLEAGHHPSPVRILSNTPGRQAVHHPGLNLTGIAFFEPGSQEIVQNLILGVDTPCLVLLQVENDACTLSVANPENRPSVVTVTLTCELAGNTVRVQDGTSRITVALPDGMDAGKSVTQTL